MKAYARHGSGKRGPGRQPVARPHGATVISDSNRAERRRLRKLLGRKGQVTFRPDGPEELEIEGATCSSCGSLMRHHLKPDYKCPISVIGDTGIVMTD